VSLTVPPIALPTTDLRALVERYAQAPGRWQHLVPGGSPAQRWYERLHRDDEVEVWLLGWGPTHHTELHDHGRSRGAFRVVEGALTEVRVADDGRQVRRRVGPGQAVTIERGDLHDVANRAGGDALSIHAYSPPLTEMTYFEVTDVGPRAVRTLAVDGPDDER